MRLLACLILILLAPVGAWAEKGAVVEIKDFYISSYTNSFTRGLEINLRMQMKSDGKKTSSELVLFQDRGAATRRFDSEWVGVAQYGHMLIGDEKTPLSILNLFDPASLRLIHSIDMEDLSITSYEWTNVPKSMRLGETITVGRVSERSPDDRLTSQGIVQFRLRKTRLGYEFCTIENATELESKEKNIVRDCDLFDVNKKLIGNRLEMLLGKSLRFSGRGEIKIN